MADEPIISVCVITRNQEKYIRRCLESILEQKKDWKLEILVGDDCSDDGTSEIVAELAVFHSALIAHIRHEPRIGAFANMRGLMARAKGDFIARVDGDDYWLPGKLKRQLDYLEANPDCAAVYTDALTVDEVGNSIGLFNDVGDACFDLAAMLRRGNFLNNSSVLFRAEGRQAWLEVDEPQVDYRVHLWHARNGYLVQLGEPLTVYRVNAEGSMVSEANSRVRELYWEAIMTVPRDLVSDRDFALSISNFLRRVCFHAVSTRHFGLAKKWAPRVFAVSPYGTARTVWLTLCSIARAIFVEIVGRLRKGPDGKRVKVLYRS